MENNIVCSRYGSINVRCEACGHAYTREFYQFAYVVFYYGWYSIVV
jgi:hypothetical protein